MFEKVKGFIEEMEQVECENEKRRKPAYWVPS